MGIQGLLPQLKSIMQPMHIKDLQGRCVAVDTYSWLHKGALSCSKELCKGLPTSKHIKYCMHRVNLLHHYGVKPILVFDGGLLPMKIEQENKRARSRKENLSRAMEHESNGNLTAAYECYQKAVDISPSMAYHLIQVLKQENISYVVAPYEADAQMTFLAITKQVDAVLTEDSDLIAFGCPRIIYKMDKFGQGVEFRYSLLQQNKDLSFSGFTKQMVLEMCILSGCDYLQSLPGMGLKKAHALIKKFRTYDKVIKHLKYNCSAVSPLYEESFKKAIMTFQHQRVYDPAVEDIVHLLEISTDAGEDLEFLGPLIPQDVAKGIAKGDLDPFTKMPLQGEVSGADLVLNSKNLPKKFKPESERKKLDLPAQKNLLTNYFCVASLEAKRNFIAPRGAPQQGSLGIETSTLVVDLTSEAKSSEVSSSFEGPLHSEDKILVDSPSNHEDSERAAEASEFSNTLSLGQRETDHNLDGVGIRHGLLHNRIQKPCMMLHKERASRSTDVKMKLENGEVVVRSSYFLHKYVRDIGQDNEGNGRVGNVTTDQENTSNPDRADVVAPRIDIFGSSNSQLQSSKESGLSDRTEKPLVHDGAAFLQKYVYKSGSNVSELKMSTRKNTVRSSYFNKRSMNENTQELDLDGTGTESCDGTLYENIDHSSSGTEAVYKRRKMGHGNRHQINDENDNPSASGTSLNIRSNCVSEPDSSTEDVKAEEGKFGCNISHLDQYSNVAEKSMEKFVSVISSFRYNLKGSRASGLRAPLKDTRNTSEKRKLSGILDVSKYAYVPTKPNAASTHRKLSFGSR